MKISAINQAIIQGQFSNEDLISVIEAVKFARAKLTQKNKRSMAVGDTVEFTSTRSGITLQGTVRKIAIKFVTVATQQGLWRVPANMLNKVEKEIA